MNSQWNIENPPLDGTPIVAIGRVIWEDEFSISSEPFALALFWLKNESGFEGWHYWYGDQLSLATALDQIVKIDFWLPFPEQEKLSRLTPAATEAGR